MSGGLLAYGAYVPSYRLERSAIAAQISVPTGAGTRSVACFDEDSTSMAVEAAREALAGVSADVRVGALYFATTTPAYEDKTNATAIHAALSLDRSARAVDMVGSVRSTAGALLCALESSTPVLVAAADIRTGLPASADEMQGGDGASAVLAGATASPDVIAEFIDGASATEEFLDRWRLPGDPSSSTWEERFGEEVYARLGDEAFSDAIKSAGLTPSDFDHVIVTGVHARGARRVLKATGVRPETVVQGLSSVVGNTGAADPLLMLASVLDVAQPGELIALVVLADGVDVLIFRATEALASRRARWPVADQIESGGLVPYTTFLEWRGHLARQPQRRPLPGTPDGPPSVRAESWKFAFRGSRCVNCGTRHLPPQRLCCSCAAIDRMEPESMADAGGTVASATVDRLAYSPSPPAIYATVDFDGGGRSQFELTDAGRESAGIGTRVEMTFRRFFTLGGVHNYFWKARPARRVVT